MDTAGLLAAVRHRWWVVALFAVLGIVGAAVATQAIPSTYEATTTLLVTPTGTDQASSTSTAATKLVNLDTEAQIVTSAAVAERVKTALRSPKTASELAGDVKVEVPPNTTLLSIHATAGTPAEAQAESRGFAEAYLAQRAEVANAAVAAQVKVFQARINDVTKRLQLVSGQAVTLPADSPDRAYAELQQRILIDQITSLSQEQSKLEAITVTPGRVLSLAALPGAAQQSGPIVYVAAGLLLGLVLGLAVTLLLARLDGRIRWPGDIEALGHVPLLGAIPSAGQQGKRGLLPAVAASASPIGQAFGQIRNGITTALPNRPATLLVAGTEPGPGASVVAANLAVALARSGVPVLMVCADLEGSSVERLLGLEGLTPAKGLSEALTTDVDPPTLLRASPAVRGLWVLGTGIAKADAADLLQSRQFEWVLSVIQEESYVVVEAPPTSAGAEAQAMARLCDAATLVVEAGRTRLDALDEGARQISRVGTTLLGAIMVERQPGPARKPAKPKLPAQAPALPGDFASYDDAADARVARRAAYLPADPTVAIRVGELADLQAAEFGTPGPVAGLTPDSTVGIDVGEPASYEAAPYEPAPASYPAESSRFSGEPAGFSAEPVAYEPEPGGFEGGAADPAAGGDSAASEPPADDTASSTEPVADTVAEPAAPKKTDQASEPVEDAEPARGPRIAS
jgi:capsular polysaccharide biosynthesis protein/Mrp family chromosome partitioning ATPase